MEPADRYFEKLAGHAEPEAKRKIIGELFIRIFEDFAKGLDDANFWCRARSTPT